MQQYALSTSGEWIGAQEAVHQVDYVCPECRGQVRVRRGEERAAHFFHRSEGSSCRLRLKDGVHESVQDWLIEMLGIEGCTKECYFSEIGRVADVAYQPKQIVFEVQLSPMSAQEVVARTTDYWGIGWHVIWILHAQTFGHYRASSFEEAVLSFPHYFTNVGFREGCVWDELSFVRGGRRRWYVFPPKRKDLSSVDVIVLRDPPRTVSPLPVLFEAQRLIDFRKSSWTCHIAGDWLSNELPARKPPRVAMDELWRRLCLFVRLLWVRQISG